MVIRSYRRVFDIERRIYRVDRIRLNPGGIPVRGLIYFLVILLGALLLGRLPLLGALVRTLPWYLRVLALPGLTAALLSVINIEGRPFHLGGRALWRYWIGPRWLAGVSPARRPGSRWHPQDLLVLPDGSDSRMRRLRYTGPGAVLITLEHEREGAAAERGSLATAHARRRPSVSLRAAPGGRTLERARVLALAGGVRLLVRAQAQREQ